MASRPTTTRNLNLQLSGRNQYAPEGIPLEQFQGDFSSIENFEGYIGHTDENPELFVEIPVF